MSTDSNKAVVRTYFEECLNEGNLDRVELILWPDYVEYDSAEPVPIRGIQAYRKHVIDYRTAFPDLLFTIEEQIAEGSTVATRWTARATHKGSFKGISPTGKSGMLTGISFHHVAEGRIVETRHSWNVLELLQQIGAAPKIEAATQKATA